MQLAKSLHTITVLVNLARYLMLSYFTVDEALARAVEILKLDDKEDVYDLIGKARKQLEPKS